MEFAYGLYVGVIIGIAFTGVLLVTVSRMNFISHSTSIKNRNNMNTSKTVIYELGSCLISGHLIEKARRNKSDNSVQRYNHHAQSGGRILIEGEREDLWNTLDEKYWGTFTPTN